MLSERYPLAFLRARLLPAERWRPFPPGADRAAWNALCRSPGHRRRRDAVVAAAEEALRQPMPELPASRYMDFIRNGDRGRYERPFFARRSMLSSLVLAECFEHKGRFLDRTVDCLWAIMEETTWCVPAHVERVGADPLPRLDRPTVDLFACETAMTLAEAYYLLRAELDAVSPAVGQRLRAEVLRRVIEPVETRDDHRWFSMVHNWNPWCSSNVLGAAMYLIEDSDRLARLTARLMGIVDRFIAAYPPDGGCDEGPGYWNVAAGALLMFLELLHGRTGGAVDVFPEPLVRAMGRYIVTVHLDGPWFANFADSAARGPLDAVIACRYGERTGDKDLVNLGRLALWGWDISASAPPVKRPGRSHGDLGRSVRELFWLSGEQRPRRLPRQTSAWLPNLQVLVARESAQPGTGLVLAAKAGHNGESHNHNDIGHFIVMLDGVPCIVDIGVEAYTAKTFSSRRYEIWTIRGAAHNAPVVNGVEQAPGGDRRATNVSFTHEGSVQRLAMNLEQAYPAEARLQSLRRELTLEGGSEARVTVRDTFALNSGPGTLVVTLYSPLAIARRSAGRLVLRAGRRSLACTFDPDTLTASVETVPLADSRLRHTWGASLRRITLALRHPAAAGSYGIVFAAETRQNHAGRQRAAQRQHRPRAVRRGRR